VAFAIVSFVVLVGTLAAWALIAAGLRDAARHADPNARPLMRRYLRVHLPLAGVAVAVGVAVALTLDHYLHADTAEFFVIWMISLMGCLLPVLIYVAVDARRHGVGPGS
jgi:cytochrome bd-type quinol oxidase subunit 2